jgi:hypothetical protein
MDNSIRNYVHQGDHAAMLLVILAALIALLLIGVLLMCVQMLRLSRRISALTRGSDGSNLEQVLAAHLDAVERTGRRVDVVEQALAVLQAQIPQCMQRVNLIRYDAFDDVGGEQSFSFAITDQRGDGIILTSVYSRMDVRVYAKAIRNGRCSHALSEEEQRVLHDMAAR